MQFPASFSNIFTVNRTINLCWLCQHDPGSWLGLCLCWICYVGPICWSMLDLLRCPQMCSKASVGAIGFMLDVSHVGHIFLFFDFQGGVRLKGLNSGKADSRIFLNLVIWVMMMLIDSTVNCENVRKWCGELHTDCWFNKDICLMRWIMLNSSWLLPVMKWIMVNSLWHSCSVRGTLAAP